MNATNVIAAKKNATEMNATKKKLRQGMQPKNVPDIGFKNHVRGILGEGNSNNTFPAL